MARTCTICIHPQRQQIEKAIIENTPTRAIARQWRVSKDAPRRHKPHIQAALDKLPESIQVARGVKLAEFIDARLESLVRLEDHARQRRDIRASVAAISAYFKGVELRAKLTGELNERAPQLHLHQHLNIPEERLAAAAQAYLATRVAKTLPSRDAQILEGSRAVSATE